MKRMIIHCGRRAACSDVSRRVDRRSIIADHSGAFALEFAIVGPIFLVALLFIFSIGYALFITSVLDNATQSTARQIQVGSANNAGSGARFVSSYLCPNTYGLIDCNNVYVRVEQIDTGTCSDFYDATSGTLPIVGGVLQLGDYGGTGSDVGPSSCATSGSATGFCDAGPNEAILLSVIYAPPNFMGGLLGSPITYGGNAVSPLLATAGFETEGFAPGAQSSPC